MKNKRGVSVIIGYILLVATAIVISTLVYQWLSTYIPKDPLECPNGVSVFVEETNYNCTTNQLNFTLKNNGRFNIGGYYIHGTTAKNQTLAVTDLVPYNKLDTGGAIVFEVDKNSLTPNSKINNSFDLSNATFSQIYSLEIVPIIFQDITNRTLSCSDAKIKEPIICASLQLMVMVVLQHVLLKQDMNVRENQVLVKSHF